MMRFIIVTGLSGAGKTEATRSLEDMGYFERREALEEAGLDPDDYE